MTPGRCRRRIAPLHSAARGSEHIRSTARSFGALDRTPSKSDVGGTLTHRCRSPLREERVECLLSFDAQGAGGSDAIGIDSNKRPLFTITSAASSHDVRG